MKKIFIFISVLILFFTPALANNSETGWRRLAVYNFQGEKILSNPDLSIEYYTPDFIVVRNRNNNYFIADKIGNQINNEEYLVLGYPLLNISDGNFIQLIKAKDVQDNDAEMIIYNKKGKIVFPQDKIKNYEPLGFKYLKDGRIIGIKKPSAIVIFEADKPPLILDTPEKLTLWLSQNKIDKTDYQSKWTQQMSSEEKNQKINYNIFENWLKQNIYTPPEDEWVVYKTKDGAGIRDMNYPTRILIKPNPEYQDIVLQGKYFAYYLLGNWSVKSLNGNFASKAKFKNLPIVRGEYIYTEE